MGLLGSLFRAKADQDWNNLLQERLANFHDDKIGESANELNLHVEYVQLDEFKSLDFTILGNLKVKTLKGAKISLQFSGQNPIERPSNNLEIDTDYHSKLKHGFSPVELELDQELVQLFLNQEILKITFTIESTVLEFEIHERNTIKEKLQLLMD